MFFTRARVLSELLFSMHAAAAGAIVKGDFTARKDQPHCPQDPNKFLLHKSTPAGY